MPSTAPSPRQARARRISTIRRRVAAIALITFVLAFGVITATGSMGSETTDTATAIAAPQRSSSGDSGTTQSSGPVTTHAS